MFITNKEMIRGARPGFGSNCRRYYFMTNNETRVLGFLLIGLFFRDSSHFMSKNGVSFFSNRFLNISLI